MVTAMISGTGKKRGFTFIEILFVIIIIGILIGVSLPVFKKTSQKLELNSFSGQLQFLVSYLRERAIVERAVIVLNIDTENKKIWGEFQDAPGRLKDCVIPQAIKLDPEKKQVLIYPDGKIDAFNLTITNDENQKVALTTEGVYGGSKVVPEK